MCACHDPLVFGHRCKDEPTGDLYTSKATVRETLDMLDIIKAVLAGMHQ